MKLSQAIRAFAHTDVDGWDQSTGQWVTKVATGNILTFDRFITERSFGQKKRIFQMAGRVGLPLNISAIRDPEGNRYLVGYKNTDIAFNQGYNNVYLIQRADDDAELITMITEVAASGAPLGTTPQVDATFPIDFDRIGSSRSEFDGVYYSGFIVTAPLSIPATTDNELRINGIMYDIEEVYESVGLKGMKVNKRSATA